MSRRPASRAVSVACHTARTPLVFRSLRTEPLPAAHRANLLRKSSHSPFRAPCKPNHLRWLIRYPSHPLSQTTPTANRLISAARRGAHPASTAIPPREPSWPQARAPPPKLDRLILRSATTHRASVRQPFDTSVRQSFGVSAQQPFETSAHQPFCTSARQPNTEWQGAKMRLRMSEFTWRRCYIAANADE